MTKQIFAHIGSPAREPLHYTGAGLDNIYLTSGYETREVGGETYTSVHDAEDLHKAIAMYLVCERKVLLGREVRFLRKLLDLTQRELGAFLKVSDQMVARYEKEQTALEGATDMILRLLVIDHVRDVVQVRKVLERMGQTDDCPAPRVNFDHEGEGWKVAA